MQICQNLNNPLTHILLYSAHLFLFFLLFFLCLFQFRHFAVSPFSPFFLFAARSFCFAVNQGRYVYSTTFFVSLNATWQHWLAACLSAAAPIVVAVVAVVVVAVGVFCIQHFMAIALGVLRYLS